MALCSSSLRVPQVQASSRQNFIEALENPPLETIYSSRNPLLAMAEYQGAVMGKYVHKLEKTRPKGRGNLKDFALSWRPLQQKRKV